jgi:hypothetical protein
MKLERLFAVGLLSAGLMFTACSEEDTTDNGGTGNGGDDTTEVPVSITVDGTNAPTVGDIIYLSEDTLLQDSIDLAAGENASWNFDWLVEHDVDTMTFIDPSTTASGAAFTGANLAIETDPMSYMFLNSSATGVEVLGMSASMESIPVALGFQDPMSLIFYPMTFGDDFFDDFSSVNTIAFNMELAQGVEVDSIRMARTGSVSLAVNGWGELTSPKGTYEVIRIERTEETSEVVEMRMVIMGVGSWTSVENNSDSRTTVQFQANEFAFPLVEFEMDSLNNPMKANFLK